MRIDSNNQLDALFRVFIYLFISCLYMFRASQEGTAVPF